MSKLARTPMLGAMNLAAATAVAQEQTTTDHATELFRAGERASQQQTTTDDATELFRAGERASQAQRGDVPSTLAGATPPVRAAGPDGRLGLLIALGVLAAALAAMTARRA